MKTKDISLETLKIFSDLSIEDIDEFRNELNIMKYKKNTFLFKPGDKADVMYIIATGKIKVFTISSSGIEQMLYIYQKDDFIGGLNLIKRTGYIYYGQAIEDTMVISLSRECFDKMINKYPKVTIKILEESFLRIRHAEDLVTRLIENSADVKVASLLLSLARNFGVKKINGILLELNISRENMGSFAGLTRETVTRKLAELNAKGVIELIETKKILIKDVEYLKNIIG